MKTDILIIGSSAAGLVAAVSGKRTNPGKQVTVITKMSKTLIPCGIPYIFGSVGSSDNNILPAEKMFETMGVSILYDTVISINKDKQCVNIGSGDCIEYEKLIIATGSTPICPEWLSGTDKKNVFVVPKNKIYLDEMQTALQDCKKVITIGAGFIGVEMSDELVKAGKDVTLIEKLPNILGLAFDKVISMRAEEILIDRGVKVMTNTSVKEIIGDEKAKGVKTDKGEIIDADAIILAIGYKPNNDLANEAGLDISKHGFIRVDEYMRTENPNIYAVGDCAEKINFVTRKACQVMLASTACAEARIAGMNLYKLSAIKTFSGTISIFSTALGKNGFGVAGLTETKAKEEGFDVITGTFTGVDRHPGAIDDSSKQYVKLIAGKEHGVILGGEAYGGCSIGELTNCIGLIIQNRMTINNLLSLQIGTHPLLTASPAGYPLIKAAEEIAIKMTNNRKSN